MEALSAEEMNGIVGGQSQEQKCDAVAGLTAVSCMSGMLWACAVGTAGHIALC